MQDIYTSWFESGHNLVLFVYCTTAFFFLQKLYIPAVCLKQRLELVKLGLQLSCFSHGVSDECIVLLCLYAFSKCELKSSRTFSFACCLSEYFNVMLSKKTVNISVTKGQSTEPCHGAGSAGKAVRAHTQPQGWHSLSQSQINILSGSIPYTPILPTNYYFIFTFMHLAEALSKATYISQLSVNEQDQNCYCMNNNLFYTQFLHWHHS